MGEVNGDYYGGLHGSGGVADDLERVHEWEVGLPNADDITPLTHNLIPPELLSAFNIKLEPYRTAGDVTKASQKTISSLRCTNFNNNIIEEIEEVDDGDDDLEEEMSESKKPRRNVSPEDADSSAAAMTTADEKAVKKNRLVWTPQLHKRFVDVVARLGIKSAVPKTIMQLMNVEGLTRENVASHLQKYRLYLKRMQGGNFDCGPSNSPPPPPPPMDDGQVSLPLVSVPMMNYNGFEAHHNNFHQLQNNHFNYHHNSNHHHHHHHNQQYQYSNGVMQTGNKFGSVMSYHPHNQGVAPGDK